MRGQTQFARGGFCLLLLALIALPLRAQRRPLPEFQVEAAYLAQFGNFVQWPTASAAPAAAASFSICVLGDSHLASALPGLTRGETIQHHAVSARYIPNAAAASSCRILFISRSRANALPRILAALATTPVLTVSNISGFTASGGMIGFVLQNDRVRFEVNLSAAHRVGLKLSAQLLKVAIAVHGGPVP